MTTARHSPHQPSPLAHTLPNQDPFDSDSDQADSYTVDRMHIHIDMTDSHYLAAAAHHQDNIRSDCLPGTCSSEQPAALAYPSQDLAPYSAVSLPPSCASGSERRPRRPRYQRLERS